MPNKIMGIVPLSFPLQGQRQTEENIEHTIIQYYKFKFGKKKIRYYVPLDAPGGASYIKLSPFFTRSSPIKTLEVISYVFIISK